MAVYQGDWSKTSWKPVPLTGGAYQSRSVVAAAQRCVNLFSEPLPKVELEPSLAVHFGTPGFAPLLQLPDNAPVRGLYMASDNHLFAVAGTGLYRIDSNWRLGRVDPVPLVISNNLVKMADNGTTLILVDGTQTGYTVDLKTLQTAVITEATNSGPNGYGFSGANFIDCLDGYFVGNIPNSPSFFSSFANSTVFDSLYYASKSGAQDILQAVMVVDRFIWLIGTYATEIWYDAGGSLFPFAIVAGPYVEYGTPARYSVTKCGDSLCFLGQNKLGRCRVFMSQGYTVSPVSTFAIEQEFQTYSTVDDAIGMSYQLQGHVFYVLSFPQADKTWVYDLSANLWHEWVWLDADGQEHRHRANCMTAAYGKIVFGDRESGWIYWLDPRFGMDAGKPIKRLRSWPHMMDNLQRISFSAFRANVSVGQKDTSE